MSGRDLLRGRSGSTASHDCGAESTSSKFHALEQKRSTTNPSAVRLIMHHEATH